MQFDIRRFDIYRKIPKDLTQPTFTGACISLFCMSLIGILTVTELYYFIIPTIETSMFVYNTNPKERIPVFINITLPRLSCEFVGLDIMDDLGRHEVGYHGNSYVFPVNNDKGCRMEAHFSVNKVPGNFHLGTHSATSQPDSVEVSHIIHDLRMGDQVPDHFKSQINISSFHPLNGMDHSVKTEDMESHEYIINFVPTICKETNGTHSFPYQFTYLHRAYVRYIHGGMPVTPAIWFKYQLNPITVQYKETRKPIYSFLTLICAILGGAFTVAGIIDSIIFTTSEMYRKFSLDKLN
ncbi:hypothetical protein SNEBB_010345 [Seison nebaliae]|nr:hypothetical protein SNEBB_010345 [Seison nebaliae]